MGPISHVLTIDFYNFSRIKYFLIFQMTQVSQGLTEETPELAHQDG
jgi:hypothetical protein